MQTEARAVSGEKLSMESSIYLQLLFLIGARESWYLCPEGDVSPALTVPFTQSKVWRGVGVPAPPSSTCQLI